MDQRGYIYKLVTEFYISGTFPDPINTTEIVLIPKKANANVAYRIIAKSLANRLKEELPGYIHQSQHAFIQGRRIIDNIIIAQEMVHSFKSKMHQRSINL